MAAEVTIDSAVDDLVVGLVEAREVHIGGVPTVNVVAKTHRGSLKWLLITARLCCLRFETALFTGCLISVTDFS